MNYLLLDEKTGADFKSVLPLSLLMGKDNVCIAACDDEDYICGAMCYRYADFQYDVLWLYVAETKRRQGIGTALLDRLFQIIALSGRVYPISARFEAGGDGTLYPFFLSCSRMDLSWSHNRYFVEPREIRGASRLHALKKQTMEQKLFLELSFLAQQKILYTLLREENFVPGEYESWKEALVPELSRCILKDGVLMDLIFVQKRPDGNLELSYLYSKYTPGLAELLDTVSCDAEELYPKAKLIFDAVSPESANMANRIFPRAKSVAIYEAEG